MCTANPARIYLGEKSHMIDFSDEHHLFSVPCRVCQKRLMVSLHRLSISWRDGQSIDCSFSFSVVFGVVFGVVVALFGFVIVVVSE